MPTKTPKADLAGLVDRLRLQKTILLDFARVAADARDLRRLMAIACEQMARATGVHHSKVLRYRSDHADLQMVAGKGFKPGVIEHALVAIDMASPPGRCFQTRNVIRIGNLPENPEYRYDPMLKEHRIVSVVQAPVTVDGLVWGVLEVDSVEPDVFDEDDEQFLLAIGVALGLAIRNQQAHECRQADAERLGRQLSLTTTLIEEHNHRVRNYFQMILSLIGARTSATESKVMRAEYLDLMERIAAISLAHDLLKVDEGEGSVDAATYLDALCSGMERTLGTGPKISRMVEPILLRPDRAVPVGLVANELLTNAFKYAHMERQDSAISLRLSVDADTEEAVLTVSDNGPGLGDERPDSQGLKLVRSLAGQLSGHVHIESSPEGTTVSMRFPLFD